jgi:hypothetical protein
LGRTLWPDEDPLGRVLRASGRDYRVIGTVNDVRYFALERDAGQEMYMLLRQTGDYHTVDLVVRSAVPPASLIPGLRAALKRADPGLPAVEFRTMEQLVNRSVFTRRIIVQLLAGFGLILASLGLCDQEIANSAPNTQPSSSAKHTSACFSEASSGQT